MRFDCFLMVALCAVLAGCDEATLMKKSVPPEEVSVAKGYAELLREKKVDDIIKDLDSSLADSNSRDTHSKMAALFPAEKPESLKVVGAHLVSKPEFSSADVTLEYQFPSKWLLVEVATQKKGNARSIFGFHVTPLTDSLENLNRFTLAGKTAIQYLGLACGIGSLVFSFYAFVMCASEKNVKIKWLWMVIVLIGVGKFAVNWGTGEWAVQLIAIQIPCFAMNRQLYQAWTLSAYLPIGAIIFLYRRWKMRVTVETIPEMPRTTN